MTVLPIMINGEPKLRLIADDGKIITNGVEVFEIIDVDSLVGWYEMEVNKWQM